MIYEVGTHRYKKHFNCLECAERFYNEIKEDLKYLKNNSKNQIVKNTYEWNNNFKRGFLR